MSNSDGGFFRPIPLDNQKLIVFRYTGEGFIPTVIPAEPLEDVSAITFLGQQIVEKYPVLKEWIVGSPMDVDIEERVVHEGEYQSFKSIGLESAYPVLQGYRGSVGLGYRINFSDPLMLNRLSLTASYTPDSDLDSDERLHALFEYERHNWRAALTYNNADFYDIFGPTYRGYKGYSADVGWSKNLVYDRPRRMDLELDTAFYGGLEQVPGYQNIPSPYDTLWRLRATAELRAPAIVPRPRGRREGPHLGGGRSRQLRQRRSHPADSRWLRYRFRPAHSPFLDLAAHRRRLRQRQRRRPVCLLLLRRLRQQLRGQRIDQALPGVVQLSGRRAQCHRRADLHQGPARVEPAADPLSPRRMDRLFHHLDPPLTLHHWSRHELG